MHPILQQGAQSFGLSLTDGQAGQFEAYKNLLLEWNQKINLTAITDEAGIYAKHFTDSLSAAPYIGQGASVIDVGTGAGFPGLPLKIARPDLSLTLLDSLAKRIAFLEAVCGQLGLSGVTCRHLRAEEGGQNPALRGQFDVACARAVANLAVLCEYCLPFVKVGGLFLALKGEKAAAEADEAAFAAREMGGEIVEIKPVKSVAGGENHHIVFIKKQHETPKKYPRKAGKIAKDPLLG